MLLLVLSPPPTRRLDMLSSILTTSFFLGAVFASQSSPSVVCVAGQCLEGYTNTTSTCSFFVWVKSELTSSSWRDTVRVRRCNQPPLTSRRIYLHIQPCPSSSTPHVFKRINSRVTRIRCQCLSSP